MKRYDKARFERFVAFLRLSHGVIAAKQIAERDDMEQALEDATTVEDLKLIIGNLIERTFPRG